MSGDTPIWSHTISVEDVPESGLHVDLEADETVRMALAKAAGLRDLRKLEASLDISRRGAAGLRVEGSMSAIVGQNCVVSLEPMESEIEEPIDLTFMPSAGPSIADKTTEATIQLGDTEPPETLIGGTLDLGVIVTEFLLLGIDPYPRKEGAQFEAPRQDDPADHPFAVLAALKKGKGE